MGSSFFKGNAQKSPQIGGGNPGLEARAIGASSGAARGSGLGAEKALKGAMKTGGFKRSTGSAAYAPGPKKT